MPIDPQIQAALDAMAAAGWPPFESLAPAAARRQMEDMIAARGLTPEPVGAIEEIEIAGPGGTLAVRIYAPPEPAPGPLPILVYYHGGGFVIGSPDTHDCLARALCRGAQCLVVTPNYRKAPEARFPAAVEDAWASLAWAHEHGAGLGGDPRRLAVAGDSAGGNLAAVAALLARDAGAPALALQVLIYPVVDLAAEAPSYGRFGTGYGILTAAGMRWFRDLYLRDANDAADWRASPLKAAAGGLCPALVITAEYDLLHDEGVAYAEHLKAAGVAVHHSPYPGMIHAFANMPAAIAGAAAVQDEVSEALRTAFAAALQDDP